MKTILICTVGGSPQPVVHAVKQNRPDFVYFICSTGEAAAASDRTISERTSRTVKGTCPHCDKSYALELYTDPIAEQASLDPKSYHVVPVEDPDELIQADNACVAIEQDLATRFAGDAPRVIANYTGGTKTMTLGLEAYALRTGGRWELQVNASIPRTDLIKVTSGDIALPQDVAGLLSRDVLERAEALAERHDYEGAVETLQFLLTRTSLTPADRRPLLAHLQEYRMLAARDRLDYETALELSADKKTTKELKQLIRSVALFTGDDPWSKRDVSGLALVQDLVDNAARCSDRQRYDDAAGRLYRATELLAQIRLRREHGLRTGDLDLASEAVPEASQKWLEASRDPRGEKVKIGLFAAYRLLAEMEDPLGLYFVDSEHVLHQVIEKRNNSIFAHGLTPVDEEVWRQVGPKWQRWLEGALASVG